MTMPLLSFSTEVRETAFEPVEKTDYRIRVSEVHPEGPMILLFGYDKGDLVPIQNVRLSEFVLQCLMVLGRTFKINDEFHVRLKFDDEVLEANNARRG